MHIYVHLNLVSLPMYRFQASSSSTVRDQIWRNHLIAQVNRSISTFASSCVIRTVANSIDKVDWLPFVFAYSTKYDERWKARGGKEEGMKIGDGWKRKRCRRQENECINGDYWPKPPCSIHWVICVAMFSYSILMHARDDEPWLSTTTNNKPSTNDERGSSIIGSYSNRWTALE